MGSTFHSPPAKRSAPDPNPFPPNGPSKRSRSSSRAPPPLSVPPGHASFRLLCNASRIGGVIGKSGSIIKKLQQSTGAKIRIEDASPESPDRIILVIADAAVSGKVLLRNDEAVEVSKAQEALLLVFDRILDVAAETEGVDVGDMMMSCRLVADAAQAGSVIGKGGRVVERIKKNTGCKIRVLTDDLPLCASSSDEIIEIEGRVSSVKKALVAVSQRLQDCPPVDRTKIMGSKPYEMVQYEAIDALPRETLAAVTAVPHDTIDRLPLRSPALSSLSSCSNSYGNRVHSLPADFSRVSSLEPKALQQEVTFRILCSNDRVGGVIGKGGNIVRALQSDTGATISIGPSVDGCEDRIITITASENPESRYSPAQKAAVLVYSRSIESGFEKGLDSGLSNRSIVTARLVVPSSQVGCLLGKGGVIISEMRKATGASIRIIGTDQVPKCASDNDQVVQISGDFSSVQDALYNATGRLRDNLFASTQNSAGTRSLSSLRVDNSPYRRLQDVVPLGSQLPAATSHSLSRHTFSHGIDHLAHSRSLDRPSSPGYWSRNLDRPSSPGLWARNLDRPSSPGLWARNLDRPSSPGLWTPPPTMAGINSRGVNDFNWGLTSRRGGLELVSGSKSAIVTNTTVEIVVPDETIDSVYGENGSNLARLRQISGAKVVVHEPRPGTRDRTIVISGSPDETKAAQSLLRAFILSGSS
ncbi:KH domain-containing protein HEN4 [Vigna radiata var. radiata]|uniref:KH domain-containing protein HEN4 n=1 Tax=Vigna radiata var. radiata TaxID=3916 RepID=A0A1S3VLD8_VIGRR|nr:KH domain-containing protein HEN4 [Vigna radiata var. radiata]